MLRVSLRDAALENYLIDVEHALGNFPICGSGAAVQPDLVHPSILNRMQLRYNCRLVCAISKGMINRDRLPKRRRGLRNGNKFARRKWCSRSLSVSWSRYFSVPTYGMKKTNGSLCGATWYAWRSEFFVNQIANIIPTFLAPLFCSRFKSQPV